MTICTKTENIQLPVAIRGSKTSDVLIVSSLLLDIWPKLTDIFSFVVAMRTLLLQCYSMMKFIPMMRYIQCIEITHSYIVHVGSFCHMTLSMMKRGGSIRTKWVRLREMELKIIMRLNVIIVVRLPTVNFEIIILKFYVYTSYKPPPTPPPPPPPPTPYMSKAPCL